jgi:hypothetical protein
VLLDEWFPAFQNIVLPLSSKVRQSRKTGLPLKRKASHSFEISETIHPSTQLCIAEELNPQPHRFENPTFSIPQRGNQSRPPLFFALLKVGF